VYWQAFGLLLRYTVRVDATFRFTHIAVDHVTVTRASPVIFVTSLEGRVFKYAQLPAGGGAVRACLVEVVDLTCRASAGGGSSTPRSILLDAERVIYSSVEPCQRRF